MRKPSIRTDLGRSFPVLAGVLAIAIAACGSASASAEPTAAPTEPAASVEASEAPAPTAAPTTVQVGGEFWFAGFHVTLGQATVELEPGRGGSVTIEATFENTGDEPATLDATLNLASAGENARPGFEMDLPSVPAGASGEGVLAFDVEDSFTFDDAVLTVGQATNQQAIVPLTTGGGEAVTREPRSFDLTGDAQADDLRLELASAELRADTPYKHGQMEKGSLALTVTYAATFDSGFAGGFAFTGENVALRLPDGTTVGPIQDGQSQSTELIGPNSTAKDLFTRFEIDEPASGDYALLVRSFGKESVIPFSID